METFDEIVDGIEAEADRTSVFFKDMAVHVHNPKGYHADDAFLARFSNAFLIRDPEVAILSHLKQNPDTVFEEFGYDAQFALFERVGEMTGTDPVVMDARDLEADPEGIIRAYCAAVGIPFVASALQWDAVVPPQLTDGDPWRTDMFATTGFQAGVEALDPTLRHHPRFEEYRDRSMPYYLAMSGLRTAPTER